jgi:2'-hydroxyisoflavone reductase
MNVLVLGGTQFIGRAIVQELLNRKHAVTIFHRGKTGADLFPECAHILGDRNTDLALCDTQEWDCIVDVSCYLPDQARNATKLRTKHFTFISTISVYDLEGVEVPLTEMTKISEGQEGTEVTGTSYGPMKVRCEEILQEAFADRFGIVRPGIVFGPHDHTGRFPYWVSRLDQYEEVLMPDMLNQPLQWVHVADLAEFTVHVSEDRLVGTWNAIRPGTSFGAVIDEIRQQVGKKHELILASAEELTENEVGFWADLPLVFPDDKRHPIFKFDPKHAERAGLKHRSVSKTVQTTLEWCRTEEFAANFKGGMTREKELEVLAKLKAKA